MDADGVAEQQETPAQLRGQIGHDGEVVVEGFRAEDDEGHGKADPHQCRFEQGSDAAAFSVVLRGAFASLSGSSASGKRGEETRFPLRHTIADDHKE